jgi:hypothetical protein
MTLLPRGVKVHLALDVIDMRKGLDGPCHAGRGLAAARSFFG